MNHITTNRELYLAVCELVEANRELQPTLESYLLTLRHLGLQFESHTAIGVNDFFGLVRDSFSIPSPPYDPAWADSYVAKTDGHGFTSWLKTITNQIVDLHEMKEAGTLQNEYRYFGISSPRGSHWVNFDPCTYLECALVGSIGGWEPNDESGRSYVPGPVAVLDDNGKIVTRNPEDIPRPIYPVTVIPWEVFIDILHCGQYYE